MAHNLVVNKIGRFARQAISCSERAVVSGVTSRGIFLQLESQWIAFLTTQSYSGPLTMNVSMIPVILDMGARGFIEDGVIYFDRSNLSLNITTANLWQPPARPAAFLSHAERWETLLQVASILLTDSTIRKNTFSTLLTRRPGFPASDLALDNSMHLSFHRLLDQWQASSVSGAITPGLLPAYHAFLGLGPGLTPSGDDLISGFLLALNRWGDVLAPAFPVDALNHALLSAAECATTLMSASLLRCAAAGEADERLVNALDGLVAGQSDPETIAAWLKDYGSSSGLDTLVGFSIVLA